MAIAHPVAGTISLEIFLWIGEIPSQSSLTQNVLSPRRLGKSQSGKQEREGSGGKLYD